MQVLDLGRVVGMSAYELAVNKGYEGTLESWLESLRYDHSDEYKQFTETIEAAKQDILSSKEEINSGKEEIKLSMTQIRDLVEKSLIGIENAQKAATEAVKAEETEAVSNINSAESGALSNIGDAETNAMASLASTLDSAIRSINEKGTRWEKQIEDTGTLAKSEYNQNATEKQKAFDDNAKKKQSAFDTHVAETQTTLDNHIKEKQDEFDSNATEKQTAFDENANQKTQEFDDHTEQIQADIGQLKEDLSNKISKFYASNQGEAHLSDSSNGKIMDMTLYGKSEQKQYTGKNLIDIDTYYSALKQGNGTYKGTASNFNSIRIPVGKYVDTQISISCKISVPLETTLMYFLADINNSSVRGRDITAGKSGTLTITITPKTEKDTIKISYGDGNLGVAVVSEFQIEKSFEATSYEPYTGGQPSPSPDYPQEIKSVVNPTVKVTNEDGLKVQSVTLNNITLNAIPVSSGGNVTIDGQQYIADYVDVERGKLVQRIWRGDFDGNANERWLVSGKYERFEIRIDELDSNYSYREKSVYCNRYKYNTKVYMDANRENGIVRHGKILYFRDSNITDFSESGIRLYLAEHPLIIITYLDKPIEIDLTQEEISIFKKLATYYPITNISVTSEQLDGYTIFNYPISMANGWNYVKQQISDNREYIYDMDNRTNDIDIQAAEAYVNSEYAVTLTELGV